MQVVFVSRGFRVKRTVQIIKNVADEEQFGRAKLTQEFQVF